MLKRLELLAPDSCLNKAGPDEPVFVLRAKDKVAAMAVRHWATMAVGTHDAKKIAEALKWAEDADAWRAQNTPPMPVGAVAAPYVPTHPRP